MIKLEKIEKVTIELTGRDVLVLDEIARHNIEIPKLIEEHNYVSGITHQDVYRFLELIRYDLQNDI